jgi:hypothetical protein
MYQPHCVAVEAYGLHDTDRKEENRHRAQSNPVSEQKDTKALPKASSGKRRTACPRPQDPSAHQSGQRGTEGHARRTIGFTLMPPSAGSECMTTSVELLPLSVALEGAHVVP